MPDPKSKRDAVLAANIAVHTSLAAHYQSSEPHFRPENQAKVKARLEALRKGAKGGRLLDVGCGTGFIINLAVDLFDEIDGVDITPAMMSQIDLKRGNIKLHQTPVETMPFPDASFDVVTAYSFIDHLLDPTLALREIRRVLKPGGVFYADLVPSRLFWAALTDLPHNPKIALSDIVTRELAMVTSNAARIETEYGIDAKTFIAAEPGKESGGIDPETFRAQAVDAGFASCDVVFDWFLGQGPVSHGQSFEDAAVIDAYLRRAAPLADHLYKYVTFYARR
jgi:ubiquinone/menaquinone biosynthesis C-methylase UbiE